MIFPVSETYKYNLQMLSARELALNTPELLEHILLQLPQFDLLVNAQRASKQWNELIQTSPTLQQHLFFQPVSQKSGQEQIFNPLLKASFGPFFDNHDENSIRWNTGIPFHELSRTNSDEKRTAFVKKEACWRRMLPAQPAIRQLKLVCRTHAMGGDSEKTGEADFKDGIRMGNLYDLAHEQASRQITRVGFNWTNEETSTGLLGMPTNSWTFGADRHGLLMLIHHTMQCVRGLPTQLVEFQSEGYEKVKINWGTTKNVRRR